MTSSTHESDSPISFVNSAALRREIAERLSADLDRKPIRMPPRLTLLMKRLRDDDASRLQPDLDR
jgi:hypothetical protein